MLLSDPILKTTVADRDELKRLISVSYPFLDKDSSLLLIEQSILEIENLVFIKTEQPASVTYLDLIEYISKILVLKGKLKANDIKKAEAGASLTGLYEQTVWNILMGTSPDIFNTEHETGEMKDQVWSCFLSRIEKGGTFRVFCIEEGKMAFRREEFHNYISDQLMVYSFKKSMKEQNEDESIRFQKYFRKKLDYLIRCNNKAEIREEDYEDLVSNRLTDFLKVISRDDFKLTSALDTYLQGFVLNGIKDYYRKKSKAPHFIELGKEALRLTTYQYDYLERHDLKILTRFIIMECSKGNPNERYMLRPVNLGKKSKVIALELGLNEGQVRIVKYRFIMRIGNALRNSRL